MGESLARTKLGQSVIAIANEEDKFRAVELQRQDQTIAVIRAKTSELDGEDWESFAAECDLITQTAKPSKDAKRKTVVVGFGTAGVAFYHINLPAVSQDETGAMVKMQAESLLPLPSELMEVAWRSNGNVRDGKVGVTIAAARRDNLQRFMQNVRALRPRTVLLSCEGIVKAWQVLFNGSSDRAAVLSLGARSTQVCLVENGRLNHAAVFGIGIEDFPVTTDSPAFSAGQHRNINQQNEAAERFAQDITSFLESFGFEGPAELPIVVLSDGGREIEDFVSNLRSLQVNASVSVPDTTRVKADPQFRAEDIYNYRVPIGLALAALETPTSALNLFRHLHDPLGAEAKRPTLYSPQVAGLIAAIMLVVLVVVAYALDMATEKDLSALVAKANFKEAERKSMLLKTVARQRPDLLELLTKTNSGDNKGIVLDSLHFKKGEVVTLRGRADNAEQMWEFQKNLADVKGLSSVQLQNPSKDKKTNKIQFTMTFHYRNFTRKAGGL